MKMKATVVEGLLNKMNAMEKKQEEWIDSLPGQLRESFFDNDYVNSLRMQIDALIAVVFENWTEDVGYFLYENAPHEITTDKGVYHINTVKEYVDYLVAEGFCEEDRS